MGQHKAKNSALPCLSIAAASIMTDLPFRGQFFLIEFSNSVTTLNV